MGWELGKGQEERETSVIPLRLGTYWIPVLYSALCHTSDNLCVGRRMLACQMRARLCPINTLSLFEGRTSGSTVGNWFWTPRDTWSPWKFCKDPYAITFSRLCMGTVDDSSSNDYSVIYQAALGLPDVTFPPPKLRTQPRSGLRSRPAKSWSRIASAWCQTRQALEDEKPSAVRLG